jgi:hypothetical protein
MWKYMGKECSIDKHLSLDSQAFQMFKAGVTPLDVSICLNVDTPLLYTSIKIMPDYVTGAV